MAEEHTEGSVLAGDTIVAPATAPGRSAIAMVRISGPETCSIIGVLTGRASFKDVFPVREPVLVKVLGRSGEFIDQAIVIRYGSPHSYTGEDMAEVMCHGSPAVIRECIAHCVAAGARPADPGEFTLRALRNGKLDLAQAEAVRDLVDAATVEQATIAARQLHGEVTEALQPLADRALNLLADLEAGLDFAEEEVELAESADTLAGECDALAQDLNALKHASGLAKRIREGSRVVLLGPPNAGKSALFNALVGYERAIVTEEAGTTRDLVEETLVIEGMPVVLIDAAGIGQAQGLAEAEGMRRAKQAAARAQLCLQVFDLRSSPPPACSIVGVNSGENDGGIVGGNDRDNDGAPTLLVGTHADLVEMETSSGVQTVSSVTGSGVDLLRKKIAVVLGAPGAKPVESVALATERHRVHADRAREALERSSRLLRQGTELELVAVEIRVAVRSLKEILGAIGPEELLGRIFSRFCIGK